VRSHWNRDEILDKRLKIAQGLLKMWLILDRKAIID